MNIGLSSVFYKEVDRIFVLSMVFAKKQYKNGITDASWRICCSNYFIMS